MASKSSAAERARPASEPGTLVLVCLAAWAVPGAAHFWLGRRQKALVFFLALTALFVIGLLLKGRLFPFEFGEVLVTLAAFASFGLGVPSIIDHMGGMPTSKGLDHPGFRRMLDLLARGKLWVKLSGSYRVTAEDVPYRDTIPMGRALVAANPEQVVWATDWPHPVSKKQPPNEADLLELLYRIAPDAASLERILVQNPAQFFGFDR